MDSKKYSELYIRRLELIQKYGARSIKLRLCFAPIGTNIIFLATELLNNSRLGFKSVITQGAYDFDKKTMQNFNEKHGTEHTLMPWVLQRYDDHYDNPEPWRIWFRGLTENEANSENPEAEIEAIDSELSKIRSLLDDPQLVEFGLCVRYVLRFNSESIVKLLSNDMVNNDKCIAVHIRRGDACNDDLTEGDPNRAHFSLESYAKDMEKCIESGYNKFYVLTESDEAIEWLKRRFESKATISFQNIDRSKFTDLSQCEYDQQNFIEFRCLDDPEFLRFTLNSALVDIYNAQQCEGFIGTLSSQFSTLNYLNIVGNAEREVPLYDLSNSGFKKQLFHPTIECSKDVKLLVIKERDVGLFSLVLQVVNTILCIDEQNLPYFVYVDFGKYQNYYTGGNTWDACFEEIFLLHNNLINKVPDVRDDYEKNIKNKGKWDREGVVYMLPGNILWTASYYPKLGKEASLHHIDHQKTPTNEERTRAAKVFSKYLKPKRHLDKRVNDFCKEFLDGRHVLGVQFRGSDVRKDFRRVVAKYSDFKSKIEQYIDSVSQDVVIFVATDEEAFLDFIRSEFPNVCAVPTVRHEVEDDDVVVKGPLGQGMPSFIDKDKAAAVEGVMLDYLILCRCDYMIHSLGSVTNAVLLTRPDLKSELIGAQYKSRGTYPQLVEGCNIAYEDGYVALIHPLKPENNLFAEETIGKLCEICDGWSAMPKVLQKLNSHLPDNEQWTDKKLNKNLKMLINKGFVSTTTV